MKDLSLMTKSLMLLFVFLVGLFVSMVWQLPFMPEAVADEAPDLAVVTGVETPGVWIGEPVIVGQSIEVDAPEIIVSETSYTQVVRYRQVIEYEVRLGIGLE